MVNRPHVSVTIEAERDAIIKRVLTPFRFLNDVMKLDLETLKFVTKATPSRARD